jgi:hypothetical protein
MRVTWLALLAAGAVGASACQSPERASRPAEAAPAPATAQAAGASGARVANSLVAPTLEPAGDIEFKAALDLGQAPKGGEPQLRGGEEATSAQWPASLYATFNVPGGRASCTAALIGPKVMLTAAHCVPVSGLVTFTYRGHPQPYAASCTRHPNYSAATRDASADFALCTVSPAFAAPAGFTYETVNTSGMTTVLKQRVILTGFGCVSNFVADDQTDGKYRIGFNTIDETSASMPPHLRHDDFYAPKEKNNLFTTNDPGTANLCPGDSGGPAFMQSPGAADVRRRTIVGVNSRVFYLDATQKSYGSSLISATGGPDFRGWAQQWATRMGVVACGVLGTQPNCRS